MSQAPDLFFVLNNAAAKDPDGPASLKLNGRDVPNGCIDCLREWFDALERGEARPLPCNMTLDQVIDRLSQWLTPPATCIVAALA